MLKLPVILFYKQKKLYIIENAEVLFLQLLIHVIKGNPITTVQGNWLVCK